MMDLKQSKITIFGHNFEGTTGWDDELIYFLLKNNIKEILNIRFPFVSSESKAIKGYIYKSGEKKEFKSFIKFYKPEVISYAKDFFIGIFYGFKYAKNSELFVGMNNLLALVGIILRKFGIVKKVAYCMIDYTPVRYKNPILDKIYYSLDKFSCYHSDVVWPLHERMIGGRVEDGKLDKSRVNYFVVPSGNNSDNYSEEEYQKYNQHKLIYFGGIVKSKGAELFVPIAQELVKQGVDFKFELIGPGELDYLKNEVAKAGLEEYFTIHGPIADMKDIEKMLFEYGLAIAPYYAEDKNSFSFYADPGKIKIYLGAGLPIVVTDVPPVAKDIAKAEAGLISKYDAKDFADKIINIISKGDYSKYKNNALRLGREFAWSNIFKKALDDIG